MNIEVSEEKDVFIVVSNTDLTEGRGKPIIKAVCESLATAKRIGAKGYVMGSHCPIDRGKAYRINNCWYARSEITRMTKEDEKEQIKIDRYQDALTRAKELGLSDEDMKALGVNPVNTLKG